MAKEKTRAKDSKVRLGEMLVEHQIITKQQMRKALSRQGMMGGRLGQNLIHLGYIDEQTLLQFLANQLRIPCVNLVQMEISPETQRLIPLETMLRNAVLPVRKEKNMLYVGMTDPTNQDAIKELEFSLGMKIVVMAMAESQWNHAVAFFEKEGWGRKTLTKTKDTPRIQGEEYDLPLLMRELIAAKGSDIHLTTDVPPTFRIHEDLVRLDYPALTEKKIENLLRDVLTPGQRKLMSSNWEVDLALHLEDVGRFRLNIYRQRGRMAAALRHVIEKIPSLRELNLPPWLSEFATRKQGLILVTGPSGHGKSTTLASLIDIINTKKRVNIVTLEDPIEYIHSHKQSNVNQRELGTDTASFEDGIKYIFRQDPDVISIGEMRDLESISTALTAAETGHLVLATLHTLNATSTIDRIIDAFPGDQQNQVRHQLADSLLVILSQRLVPRSDRPGRILAYEKLINTYRISNSIREKRAHLIKTQSAGMPEDFSPLEQSLVQLMRKGRISFEEGRKFAQDVKTFELLAKQ